LADTFSSVFLGVSGVLLRLKIPFILLNGDTLSFAVVSGFLAGVFFLARAAWTSRSTLAGVSLQGCMNWGMTDLSARSDSLASFSARSRSLRFSASRAWFKRALASGLAVVAAFLALVSAVVAVALGATPASRRRSFNCWASILSAGEVYWLR